jgi:predicted kinase
MNYNGTLYLIRGLPGSGKSTLAEELSTVLSATICCADDYFMDSDGNYNFDHNLLGKAHKWCQNLCEKAMDDISNRNVIVSNTTTTTKEVNVYMNLAKKYNYKVVSIVVENRHGGVNVHGVNEEVLDKMENRFSLKLR